MCCEYELDAFFSRLDIHQWGGGLLLIGGYTIRPGFERKIIIDQTG